MKLSEHTITQFTDVLGSDAPAPGGGSTAALEGALGIALTDMVAKLTIGREKYAEHEELMKELSGKAEQLRRDLVEMIDKDTEAFEGVSAVFGMPRGTDEEKAARGEAMQNALKESTRTPFRMMELSIEALRITDRMMGKSNTNALSDLGVAALSLKAALQGAWLNILINVGSIKDQEFVKEYSEKGQAILAEGLPLADKIYTQVLESL